MTGALTREENLVDKAVQELMSWQTDEPTGPICEWLLYWRRRV
jgi:hypothetical protein